MTTLAAGNVSDETRLSYYRKALKAKQVLEKAEEEARSARGVYRSVLKDAKKAGVTSDELTFALLVRGRDADEIAAEMKARLRMLRLADIVEPDLFRDLLPILDGATDDDETIAFDEGKRAGAAGHASSVNPYPPGREFAEIWHRGWLMGQADNAMALAPKKAGRPRKGKLEVNGAAAH